MAHGMGDGLVTDSKIQVLKYKCCALEVGSAARRGRAANGLRSKGYVGLRVMWV